MKFNVFFIVLMILLGSCAKQNPVEQIPQLSGYWEITEVELPDGTKRTFGISTTIDYITINEMGGVRIKVDPKLDGSFNTSGSAEAFELKIENDSLFIHYKTPYDSWVEAVLKTGDSTLVLKNRDNKIYTYKRFKKFEL